MSSCIWSWKKKNYISWRRDGRNCPRGHANPLIALIARTIPPLTDADTRKSQNSNLNLLRPPFFLSSASVSYILSTTIWNGDNLAWNYFAIRRNNAIFEKEFHAKMLFYSASNIFLKEGGRFKMNLYADFRKCSPVFNGGGGWNFRAWMYPHGFFRGNLLSIWFIDTPRNSWLNICRCIKYNGVGRECLIEDTREITRSRGSPINYSSLPPSLPFPVM